MGTGFLWGDENVLELGDRFPTLGYAKTQRIVSFR